VDERRPIDNRDDPIERIASQGDVIMRRSPSGLSAIDSIRLAFGRNSAIQRRLVHVPASRSTTGAKSSR
jgi:hypothetical protein